MDFAIRFSESGLASIRSQLASLRTAVRGMTGFGVLGGLGSQIRQTIGWFNGALQMAAGAIASGVALKFAEDFFKNLVIANPLRGMFLRGLHQIISAFGVNVPYDKFSRFMVLWASIAWGRIKSSFSNFVSKLGNFFTGIIKRLNININFGSFLRTLNTLLGNYLAFLLRDYVRLIGYSLGYLAKFLNTHFVSAIKQMMISLFYGIWDGIKNLASKLGGMFSRIFGFLTNSINTIWPTIKKVAQNLWSSISSFFSNLWSSIFNKLPNFLAGLLSYIFSGFGIFASLIKGIAGSLLSLGQMVGGLIYDSVKNILKFVFSNLALVLSSLLPGIFSSIRKLASKAWHFVWGNLAQLGFIIASFANRITGQVVSNILARVFLFLGGFASIVAGFVISLGAIVIGFNREFQEYVGKILVGAVNVVNSTWESIKSGVLQFVDAFRVGLARITGIWAFASESSLVRLDELQRRFTPQQIEEFKIIETVDARMRQNWEKVAEQIEIIMKKAELMFKQQNLQIQTWARLQMQKERSLL